MEGEISNTRKRSPPKDKNAAIALPPKKLKGNKLTISTSHFEPFEPPTPSTTATYNSVLSPPAISAASERVYPPGTRTFSNSTTGSPVLPTLTRLQTLNCPQNKQAFLNVFSELYDANGLTAQLKEQLRKSNTLLQTLQASGAMIEGLVKGHFRELQIMYSDKFGFALTDLNKRLQVLEGSSLTTPQTSKAFGSNGDVILFSPVEGGNSDRAVYLGILNGIMERLEKLEKAMEEKNGGGEKDDKEKEEKKEEKEKESD